MRAGVFAALAVVSLTGAAQKGPAQNKNWSSRLLPASSLIMIRRLSTNTGARNISSTTPCSPAAGTSSSNFASNPPPGFKYEMGAVAADGNVVMVHGRYTGFGPKLMIAVDMFRIEKGKIVEHWDVLQEEVPASQTKSGNPMFVPGM
ncbi:nuclear transport factor 2 family protein [Sinorhizobium medicae]